MGIAGSVHRDAGDVEHPLAPLPQERQQQRGTAARLVGGPEDVEPEAEHLVEEGGEVLLDVLDPAREQDLALRAEHHRPVERLSRIHANPYPPAHCAVPPVLLVYGCSDVPSELPADGSLRSDLLVSRHSLLAVGVSQGAEGQIRGSRRAAEY